MVPLTVQSFLIPTRTQPGPAVTIAPDLGILPTSTTVPETPTLIPTPTQLPVLDQVPGGVVPDPTASIEPSAGGVEPGNTGVVVQLVSASNAYVVDPFTLQVRRPPSALSSTVHADIGPDGHVAYVENQDAAHPGYGYSLRVDNSTLVGSPLPSATIRFLRATWAPNGASLAFVAETPGARGDGSSRIGDTPSDGLWVWTLAPGQETQFTHHALQNRYAYQYGRDAAYMVRDFEWSPDSSLLLVQLDRVGYPGGLGLVAPGSNAGDTPVMFRHEYGTWSLDGTRILVSGMQTDVGPVLGWINRDTHELVPLVNGAGMVTPLWIQSAAELQDRSIAFIGANYNPVDPEAGPNSPDIGLYIYNGGVIVRLSYIGGGPVQRATWNAGHTAVLLRLTSGRTLVARTSGAVIDITGQVGQSNVSWAD